MADAVAAILYLGAATFMSFGCVAGTTMLCCVVWKRAMDMEVLDEAARITAWLIFGWLGIAAARHPLPRSAGHRLPLRPFCRRVLAGDVADCRSAAGCFAIRCETHKREPCSWATCSVRWAA